MRSNAKPAIGIIGAGRLGTAVAKGALKAQYSVAIANSKAPETLSLILSVLLPGAKAAWVNDVIEQSDIVVLAIPLHKYTTLTPELFASKIVIDGMNYWPPTEGKIEAFENTPSSEYIQRYLPKAKVIKTLNHVAYHELEEDSLPKGTPHRRAIAFAGNDKAARLQVAQFIDDLGFDPVDAGDLREGKKFQPDTTLFNARYSAPEIKSILK